MFRRHLLFSLISLIGVVGTALPIAVYRHSAGWPFQITRTASDEPAVAPIAGLPLPPGLQAGDILDWQAGSQTSRAILSTALSAQSLPLGSTYPLSVRRDATRLTVPVTTVPLSAIPGAFENAIVGTIGNVLLLLLGLITLWWGRDWVAWGFSVYALAWSLGYLPFVIPASPYVDFAMISVNDVLVNALALFGLYIAAESLVGQVLGARLRWVFRTVLALLLGSASTLAFGRTLGAVLLGWSAGQWYYAMMANYVALMLLVTVVLLTGYRRSAAASRLRLRWILAATVLYVSGWGLLYSTALRQSLAGTLAMDLVQAVAYAGYLYGVLRHRLVDLSFVIDRALVYGGVSALVVGVIAALNSLALRATLGEGAGLLLQIVVPLALGIVLGKMRIYMDRLVERVFFRRKYLAEKALKRFARRCGHIVGVPQLVEAAVREIGKSAQGVVVVQLGGHPRAVRVLCRFLGARIVRARERRIAQRVGLRPPVAMLGGNLRRLGQCVLHPGFVGSKVYVAHTGREQGAGTRRRLIAGCGVEHQPAPVGHGLVVAVALGIEEQ